MLLPLACVMTHEAADNSRTAPQRIRSAAMSTRPRARVRGASGVEAGWCKCAWHGAGPGIVVVLEPSRSLSLPLFGLALWAAGGAGPRACGACGAHAGSRERALTHSNFRVLEHGSGATRTGVAWHGPGCTCGLIYIYRAGSYI